MSTVIQVPFEGEGSGTGELTWGQREIWRAIRLSGRSLTFGGVTPLPEGWSVGELAVWVQFLMRRHQSLRTRLSFGEDGVRQVLSSSGQLGIEVITAGDDEDPKALADAASARYWATDLDYENEWPMRVAVVVQGGAPKYAAFSYLHIALDGAGLSALLADLATMDPATHEAPPVTAMQPLELAAWQGTAAGRRQNGAALRYWETVARATPPRSTLAADPQDPVYGELWYRSPAGLPALETVGVRCRVDTGPVLLAACAVALARTTGTSPVVLLTIVGNRFRPGLADSVTHLSQRSPCLLEVADRTFEEVVAQARRASVQAGKYGYFDPDACDRMLEDVARSRGGPVELSHNYNDRRDPGRQESKRAATPEQIRALLPLSTQRWGVRLREQDHAFFLHVNDTEDALDILIGADSRFIGPAGLQACARHFEAVLVEAAQDPAVPIGLVAADGAPVGAAGARAS